MPLCVSVYMFLVVACCEMDLSVLKFLLALEISCSVDLNMKKVL